MRHPVDLHHAPRTTPSSGRLFTAFVLGGLVALLSAWALKTYDELVDADREVRARWSQLETSYAERMERVPALVALLTPAEGIDADELTTLATARAELVRLADRDTGRVLEEPELFQGFLREQQALGRSLERLVAQAQALEPVAGTPAFAPLRQQLDALDDRIAIERLRFNESVRHFNALRIRFPAMFIARGVGERFDEKSYVQPLSGAEKAPSASTRW